MVPLEHVESIEPTAATTTTTNTTGSSTTTTANTNTTTSNSINSPAVTRLQQTGRRGRSSVRKKDEGSEVETGEGKQPTKQECNKLVHSLSKDLAVYCCLSMGLGAMGDSYTLRDELRALGTKLFETVLLCKRGLIPLLMSNRLKEEERTDLEKMYRVFAGCLDLLQEEFTKVITLQGIFPLWDSNTLLIQTGVTECMPYKKLYSSKENCQDMTAQDRKSQYEEDFTNLEKKVTSLQEMSYTTSQLIDIKPWDVHPHTDHTKIDVETSDAEPEETPGDSEPRVHTNTEGPRHRKWVWVLVLVLGTAVVLAGVLGLALALNKDEGDS